MTKYIVILCWRHSEQKPVPTLTFLPMFYKRKKKLNKLVPPEGGIFYQFGSSIKWAPNNPPLSRKSMQMNGEHVSAKETLLDSYLVYEGRNFFFCL